MPTRASSSWFARPVSHWMGGRALAALVLALCLGLTYGAWRNANDVSEQQVQADFDFRVRELVGSIVGRMQTYIQVLHGVQGLYASSQDVTRAEFHAYLAQQQVDRHFPGIHGVGYLPLVSGAARARHEAQVRMEGYPGYAIRPPGQRAWHAPITYLEPLSDSNLLAFGYDILSEPVRRAALEQARDTGLAVMTGKIHLVQDRGNGDAHGFLIVLPVYDNGLVHASVEQRRAALRAWVFAPFRMGDLAGNDIGWAIRKRRHVEKPEVTYSKTADLLCELGRYGQKTGAGWYDYKAGDRKAYPSEQVNAMIVQYSADIGVARRKISDQEIVERLVYALVNEGARILEEGIALRASDIDMVYLTGYGFPLFRGGPMFYADTVGLPNVLDTINGYAKGRHGEAWTPAPLLVKLAGEGKGFNS
ncbi:MAG: CHASE domain-containing protein [Janthinobacterium sp.]